MLRDGKTVREAQHIPVRKLIDNADPSLNLLLHGGEEVLVPEAQKIYVVGNVRRPGAYPITNGRRNNFIADARSLLKACPPTLPKLPMCIAGRQTVAKPRCR